MFSWDRVSISLQPWLTTEPRVAWNSWHNSGTSVICRQESSNLISFVFWILSNFRSDPENEMFSQFYRHIYNSEALKPVQGLFVSKVHFHSVAYSPFSKPSVWFSSSLSLISRFFCFADIKPASFSYIPLFSLLVAPGYCKKLKKKKSNKIQKVVFLEEMTLYTIKLLTII